MQNEKIKNVNKTEKNYKFGWKLSKGKFDISNKPSQERKSLYFSHLPQEIHDFFLQRPQQKNVFKVIYLPINPHKTHIFAFLLFTQDIQRAVFG